MCRVSSGCETRSRLELRTSFDRRLSGRAGPDSVNAIFGREAYMTAEDRAKYVRACTMCDFMTNVACAMELSGGQRSKHSVDRL
jgi:hypothetical protein